MIRFCVLQSSIQVCNSPVTFSDCVVVIPKQRVGKELQSLGVFVEQGSWVGGVVVRTKTPHLFKSSKSSVTVRRKVFSDTFGHRDFWRSFKLSLRTSLSFPVHEGLVNM